MDWFEEWFDSPLYAKLYSKRDESEARQLIAFLEQRLSLANDAHILDLGCGRGRHSVSLAKKGYHVTGIDLSESSIKMAKEHAREEGLKKVKFRVGDMRNVLPQTFDAIFNLFTTFGYFLEDKENARVFDSVTAMLRPGGVFVLDYLNAAKVRKSFVPSDDGHFQQVKYHIKRYIKNEAIYKDIHFEKPSTGEEKTYSERVKLYELEWFQQYMADRNLIIDDVYGNYEGGAFDPEKSPRMLIISHLGS